MDSFGILRLDIQRHVPENWAKRLLNSLRLIFHFETKERQPTCDGDRQLGHGFDTEDPTRVLYPIFIGHSLKKMTSSLHHPDLGHVFVGLKNGRHEFGKHLSSKK